MDAGEHTVRHWLPIAEEMPVRDQACHKACRLAPDCTRHRHGNRVLELGLRSGTASRSLILGVLLKRPISIGAHARVVLQLA